MEGTLKKSTRCATLSKLCCKLRSLAFHNAEYNVTLDAEVLLSPQSFTFRNTVGAARLLPPWPGQPPGQVEMQYWKISFTKKCLLKRCQQMNRNISLQRLKETTALGEINTTFCDLDVILFINCFACITETALAGC